MAILSATASCEATLGYMPSFVLINTNDTLSTVTTVGYLNGTTLDPCAYLGLTPVFTTNQMALVTTSDKGTVSLLVQIDGSSNINLVPPSAA